MPRTAFAAVALLAIGCSGPTEVEPGTFEAQLRGAASASLTGSSHAGVIYTEAEPDGQFTITMFVSQNDTTRMIAITCPGLDVPTAGTYSLDPAAAGCGGRYVRILLAPNLETLEIAPASSGALRITASSADAISGTFDFRGTLSRGETTVGEVRVSGEFTAEIF